MRDANPVLAAWNVDLIVVRDGSHTSGERAALHRDVERRHLLRLGRGVYVDAAAFDALDLEGRHIVRRRALAARADRPPVFSHWSAAVIHGLPVLRSRLTRMHAVVTHPDLRRNGPIASHVLPFGDADLIGAGGLVLTSLPRTVIDLADAAPFEEGVMAADAALVRGVPREVLEGAVEAAGARRTGRRIGDVIAFAHPGAESALESRQRCTLFRLGVEVPELQHRMALDEGAVFLDVLLPRCRVGIEADGDVTYLDPALATRGAAQAVLAEKRREDAVRARLDGLVRVGWVQAGSSALLGRALARAGAHPR